MIPAFLCVSHPPEHLFNTLTHPSEKRTDLFVLWVEGNNFEKPQEGPGNGHGNGEGLDLDERTKALADKFAVLLNPKTTLTPHLCRKGCRHYDPVGGPSSAGFREFCWKSKGSRIESDCPCQNFESKISSAPEGVLGF